MITIFFAIISLFSLSTYAYQCETPDYEISSDDLQYSDHPITSACIREYKGSAYNTPIIFVEGLDIKDNEDVDEIVDSYIGQSTIDLLLNSGFSVFIVNWAQNTNSMQSNAMTLLKICESVKNLTNQDAVIIGMSMGGVIAKFALAYAEQNGMEHHTEIFISYDSPHKGANIPVSIQQSIKDLIENDFTDSDDAKLFLNSFKSVAARQLMVFNIWDYEGNYYNGFYDETRALGYPKNSRNFAISRGNVQGESQRLGHRKYALRITKYKSGAKFVSKLWTSPDTHIFEKIYHRWVELGSITLSEREIETKFLANHDDAPGGYYNSFQILGNTAIDAGCNAYIYANSHCFVPTISALDIHNLNINSNEDLFLDLNNDMDIIDNIPFEDYIAMDGNEKHSGAWSEDILNFIFQKAMLAKNYIVPTIITPLFLN